MPRKFFKKRRWRAKTKAGHKDKGVPNFSSKIVSTDGIICLILGIICLIMLIVLTIISTIHRGQADIKVGAIGAAGFVISLTCFIISVKTPTANHNYASKKSCIQFFQIIIRTGGLSGLFH